MSISEKLEKCYKNQIKIIKNEKDYKRKQKLVGALVCDLGSNSINAIAKTIGSCWRYVKKCYLIVKNELSVQSYKNRCGRKSLTKIYPTLEEDIDQIVLNHCSTDPRFKHEKQYVKLTINEIIARLIKTGKYTENSFKKSAIANLLNKMGYTLKKVQKTEPLKKIEKTNDIFNNVHQKRKDAMNNNNTVLISLDTKDKVLLGPFSRGGKNRVQIKACDHNLTNNCLIPFGILDLKTNKPYFFNFTNKPTSLDLVDCIEEFWEEQYANSNYNKLSILLDNGPDNSGVRTIFLKGLIDISKKYNIQIELNYYPPYHSKYNPAERLWARLENIWNGFLLKNVDICLNFMKNLTWKNEKSITKLKEVKYEKGLKINKKEMQILEDNHITRTDGIRKWGVLITP